MTRPSMCEVPEPDASSSPVPAQPRPCLHPQDAHLLGDGEEAKWGPAFCGAHSGTLLASAAPWATVMPTRFLVLGYNFSAQEMTENCLLLTQSRASGSWSAGSWDTLWFAGSDGGPVNPMEDGVLQTLGQVARGHLGSQAGPAVSWSQFLNHLGTGEVSASPSHWRLESFIPRWWRGGWGGVGRAAHYAWSLSLLSGGWSHSLPPLHTGPDCADLWSPLSHLRQG